jgi:hypothetical protein
MGLLDGIKKRLGDRKRARTRKAIHAALDRAFDSAVPMTKSTDEDRLVIFSDHHKGARDGADDFQRCERGYNAALTYYNDLGYHLIELGDVEELWENSFEEVASSYPRTLALAADFHKAGRYTRFWGNHDLAWNSKKFFQDHMGAYGYGDVEPIESLRLTINDGEGKLVVELFLVHGHQGTADSDRHAKSSRFFVRHGWRPLQRMLNRPWNTPSVDWGLRGEHAEHMELWAAKNRRVLIAGHTHLPVFADSVKKPTVEPVEATAPETDADPAHKQALEHAWVEWADAEKERLLLQPPITLDTPCYFNTGCCSFGDGDITGIEIRDGSIFLVRWPCTPQTDPDPPLAQLALADVYERAVKPPAG